MMTPTKIGNKIFYKKICNKYNKKYKYWFDNLGDCCDH